MIAIDTETELIENLGDKVRTFHDVPALVCTAVHCADSHFCGVWPHDDEGVGEFLEDILEDSDWGPIVFHNAAFDIAVLARHYNLEPQFREALRRRRILDTRVMYALCRPDGDRSLTLAAAVKFLLGRTLEKGDVRTSFRRDAPLTDEQRLYAYQDVEATFKLAQELLRHPYGSLSPRPDFFTSYQVYAERTDSFNPDRDFSAAAGWMAFELEPRGLAVDPERLDVAAEAARGARDAEMETLLREGLARLRRRPGASPEPVAEPPPTLVLRPRGAWTPHPETGTMYRRVGGTLVRVPADPQLIQRELQRRHQEFAESAKLTPAEPGKPPLEGEYPVSEKTGALSLEAKFWKQYKDEMPADLRAYHDMCRHRKLLSTYFTPLLERWREVENAVRLGTRPRGHCAWEHDGVAKRGLRVHPSIGVCFAETGRWTCWKPNLQNQPKSIRHIYRSPYPGHVLVSADYKSLELFTACEAMDRLGLGGGPLRNALDSGADVHRWAAARMFEKTEEEVDDDERKAAKIANFSLLGGLGVRKFRQQGRNAGLDWDFATAADVRDRWFATFTDCAQFLDLFRCDPWQLCPPFYRRRAWLEAQGIETDPWPSRWELSRRLNQGAIYECRLPSGRVVPNRRFSQAANLFFQGIGAEVVSRAFTNCCEAGLVVCMVVHDSLTISAPEREAELLALQLIRQMRRAQEQVLTCGVLIPRPKAEIGEYWS